jgi:hypothetical protein
MVHQLLAVLRPSDAPALHLAHSTLAVCCFFFSTVQCLEGGRGREHKRSRSSERGRARRSRCHHHITCPCTVVSRLQKRGVKRITLETYQHPEILAALSADDSAFASLRHNTARARLSWWLVAGRCQFALGQVAHRRVLFGKRQRSHGFAIAHIVEVVKGVGWRLLA